MEEMQGIMTLPQMGGAAPQPQANPQEEALFRQLREQVPPKEFSDELLGEAMQADPQAVKEFVDELRAQSIPMDMLMLLNKMVDEILATPQDYQRIRRQYMQQGIPEDVLPAQFDPMFFVALNMALDYLTVEQPAPMGMARGGIADLAQYGRFGDTMLAHITPEEAALLKARGGSGTINPVTGLPEFFLGKLFKSIGNAVKKFAQSSIGRIVLPIALGFFAGIPLAGAMGVGSTAGIAAVSGFVGGAGTAILQGKNIGEALKAGAIGGVTAGATAGIMGGSNAFASTQAPAPIYDLSGAALKGPQPFDGMFVGPPGPSELSNLPTLSVPSPSEIATRSFVGQPAEIGASTASSGAFAGPSTMVAGSGADVTYPVKTSSQPTQGDLFVSGAEAVYDPSSSMASQASVPTQAPASSFDVSGMEAAYRSPLDNGYVPFENRYGAVSSSPESLSIPDSFASLKDRASGIYDKASEVYGKYFDPNRFDMDPAAIQKADLAGRQAVDRVQAMRAQAGMPQLDSLSATSIYQKAYDAAMPGMIAKYAPLAGAALVGTAALGGFKTEPAAAPDFAAMDMFNPAYARPLTFGGLSGSRGYGPRTPPQYQLPLPTRAAKGGIMSLEMGGTTYPKKQGHISGPGTGTSDSIPALLSDGEFVFTAKAVRSIGNGSRRKGAKRLYSLMKMLEGRKG